MKGSHFPDSGTIGGDDEHVEPLLPLSPYTLV